MAVSDTLKLDLYNGALVEHLGERLLSSLTENSEPRRLLDWAWASGTFVNECLELGDWTFGTRTIELTYDPSIEPDFGFPRAFEKPSDWVRTVGLSSDPNFNQRLDESGYADENGYWFTYGDTIYVKYVSNDNAYGLDTSKWPEYFTDWMKSRLAKKVCRRITQSESKKDTIDKDERKALLEARGKNGMNKPWVKNPRGAWNNARNTSLNRTRNY